MSLLMATGIGIDWIFASAPLPLDGMLVVYGLPVLEDLSTTMLYSSLPSSPSCFFTVLRSNPT